MRVVIPLLLAALVGCSAPSPVADSGPADAAPDAPAPDTADAPPVDVPAVDALDAGPVDAPAPDVGDVAPVDVPTADALDAADAPADRAVMDVAPADVAPDVPDVPADRAPDLPPPDVACPSPGQTRCGGACIDLSTDALNCGACGSACPAGVACVAGRCGPCGGCAAGTTCCGLACVNTATDPANCGACGSRCCDGNLCSAGSCVVACPAGRTACPGSMSSCRGQVCVDAQTDPMNCGACGARCAAGETCVGGMCRAGGGFMALAPCGSAGDYVMGTTVRFGGAVGSAYEPRCLTVRAGATVAWEGSFGGHPLAPSTRGTAMNPVPRVSSGTRTEVSFPRAGFYPYYCTFHGSDSGGGMAGVVQVVE